MADHSTVPEDPPQPPTFPGPVLPSQGHQVGVVHLSFPPSPGTGLGSPGWAGGTAQRRTHTHLHKNKQRLA